MRSGLILLVLFGGLLVFTGLGGIEGLRQTLIAVTAQPGADGSGPVPSNAVRYRLDIAVRVDGKTIIGSKVYQIALSPGGGDGSTEVARLVTRFLGEAITIPLPGRPTLIALMAAADFNEEGARNLFYRSCDLRFEDGESPSSFIRRVTSFRGSCPVSANAMPQIMSIADRNDPRTLAVADYHDLSRSFGNGVEFVSASVSTTDEPISTGIVDELPWLKIQPGQEAHWTADLNNKTQIRFQLTRTLFIKKA